MLYSPVVLSATDYFPFGFPIPDRVFQNGNYRYGFNGQEMDNEIYGEGKSYTAEFWQYDARLGRRWNVDPDPETAVSVYATFGNNPILYFDPRGVFKRRSQAQRYQKKYGGTVGFTANPDERGKWYVAQEITYKPMLENIFWNDVLPPVEVNLRLIFESPAQEKRRLRRETRKRLVSQTKDPIEKVKVWSDFAIAPVENITFKIAESVLQGAALINPLWNLSNTATTLFTGKVIYGNEADKFDKINSVISLTLPG